MDFDLPPLGVTFMDEDHQESVAGLDRLETAFAADAETALAVVDAYIAHTRDHFGREEAEMQRTGFPPYPVHQSAHARCLAAMDQAREALAAGDVDTARRFFLEDVPQWLEDHLATMDTVTAGWFQRMGAGAA